MCPRSCAKNLLVEFSENNYRENTAFWEDFFSGFVVLYLTHNCQLLGPRWSEIVFAKQRLASHFLLTISGQASQSDYPHRATFFGSCGHVVNSIKSNSFSLLICRKNKQRLAHLPSPSAQKLTCKFPHKNSENYFDRNLAPCLGPSDRYLISLDFVVCCLWDFSLFNRFCFCRKA